MGTELQLFLVWVLVAGCFVYAAWALMPQTARRLLARNLLRWPWPARVKVFFTQAALASAGCHCAGCAHAAVRPGKAGETNSPVNQVILFQRRRKS